MSRAYSLDLRERVVAAVVAGESCRAVAATFKVSVASVVKWSQRFRATVTLPDSSLHMFDLAGDAVYVDAHVLKWRPIGTLLGLETVYELDRIAGRYQALSDEQTHERTVYSLAVKKPSIPRVTWRSSRSTRRT